REPKRQPHSSHLLETSFPSSSSRVPISARPRRISQRGLSSGRPTTLHYMAHELFLIDGNSLAYRAFFALPESIATSTGVPTNAIFEFASMLVKILTDYGPKATVVVWDAGYTGRKELYPEYKAQRSTRPDLLKEQWPH